MSDKSPIFFTDKKIEEAQKDTSYLTTPEQREEYFKKYAGIRLNNGSQVALKAAIAAENLDDANLASLVESTIPKVAYRPLCSLDGDDGSM